MAWVKTPSGRIISIDNEVANELVHSPLGYHFTTPLEYQHLFPSGIKANYPFPNAQNLRKFGIVGWDKVCYAFMWHAQQNAPWNIERYLNNSKQDEPAKSGFSSFIKATNG